ncbi:beta-mannosidase [Winogradskyella immobilis]|uniref:Beta-mannosidase B n=1 Tax=Winogradskyella immobilis TaxID=2816852 RepID=A0ABS8EID5_9FLAO|nr:glycoside hydrolase family 2 protein [Winogradskyella immobilis]MCC1482979.1 glycoside hydrolase family 2 protein [Winogradskyella immobilis]MCG0015074.1 glycoside hydrolase family 2 protein [Winogradskyella immobilis]
MRYSIIVIILLVFSCKSKHDVPAVIELSDNWQFKQVSDSIWYNAKVPGQVHTDLLKNDLIENPFVGNNELDLQWISETDWEYTTNFFVDKETLSKKHLELNFEGLDTYANVYLNDSLILKANNAFREWNINVKSIIKLENELRLVFKNTAKKENIEKAKLPYQLPEGNRIFTRKPQFQYGWDWGPKFITSGIWRPIKLIANNDLRIRNAYIIQNELNDSISKLNLHMNLAYNRTDGYTFEVFVNDSLVAISEDGFQYSPMNIPFEIKTPKRWWPHNLGEPYLYDVKVVVKDGNTILDTYSQKLGLRTIELVTEKDSIGESFYFKVNDVPVYAKGANYIPQNSFQSQVTDSHYNKLLDDVVEANMNMLRVWGGGIYENDIFYNLCDEKGILVWQDFMFACAMYPGDQAFLDNVQQEAIDNVKRLRHHPSIALWCGNNENSEGWHRWGWQTDRSDAEKEEIWDNYLKVFDSILPQTVSKYSNTSYWESSPSYGRGNPKYKAQGDAHDWWIWHDEYPFEHLPDNVPRFMSEFGFQSFPSYEAIKYINQNDSISITSKAFQTHQKHSRGFSIIKNYMERDYPIPDKDEDYVYMSQLVQAHGLVMGFEAQRRAKPYNMGTLYWQLNDCWPVTSWSSIDFMGNWKALHYKTKNAFSNVLISSRVENNKLKTWLINDNLQPENGILSLQLLDFEGKVIWENYKDVEVVPNSSEVKFQMDLNTISFQKEAVVLVSKFKDLTSNFYFSKPKDLKLKQEEIEKTVTKSSNGFKVILSSKTLQKDVFLYTTIKGHFSDNYFDILPGEKVTIHFKTEASSLDDLQFKSFNNFVK